MYMQHMWISEFHNLKTLKKFHLFESEEIAERALTVSTHKNKNTLK